MVKNKKPLKADEAFALAEDGKWVRNGGYTWRNMGEYGQYLAYGKHPENIRTTSKFTLKSFRYHGDEWVETDPDNATNQIEGATK